MGYSAYYKQDWAQAAIYLYAYIQKAPVAMSSDIGHAGEVEKAYMYSLDKVKQAINERDQLRAEQSQGGTEQRTVGITKQPPTLDKPQKSPQTVEANTKRCNVYARIAVAQNEASLLSKCSFTGLRWGSDYDGHFRWCLTVSGNVSGFETTERQRMLSQCAP